MKKSKIAAIYTQKEDIDTFLYLTRFISELDKRNIKVLIHKDTASEMQFSQQFETFLPNKI